MSDDITLEKLKELLDIFPLPERSMRNELTWCAREIERLQAAVHELEEINSETESEMNRRGTVIDRLRRALETIKQHLESVGGVLALSGESPSHAQLLESVKKFSAPDSWWNDEDDDPTE